MGVQFNRGAFERALNDKMASAVQVQADKLQGVYDRVWAVKEGKTDEQITGTAPAGVARGVRPRDPRAQLTKAVTAITEGHRSSW
jgi:hypothetical protein